MFTEFMYIALLVLILLWTCIEGRSAYGMSFGALLAAGIVMIQVIHNIKGYYLKSRALPFKNLVRDKVRDNDLLLVYYWSSLVLQPVS